MAIGYIVDSEEWGCVCDSCATPEEQAGDLLFAPMDAGTVCSRCNLILCRDGYWR